MAVRSEVKHSVGYRSDIDGLRGIAVLSVFFYHLGIQGFSGWYVGGDVFFVISGYLITSILFNEYDLTGRIDFGAFYLRRIRRIVPALTAVLVLTTLTSIFFLSPTQLIAYGLSLIATVASVSNIWFSANSGYFDGDATQKPLSHTWSLGVEEPLSHLATVHRIAGTCHAGAEEALRCACGWYDPVA